MLRALRDRRISSVELLDLHLRRIEQYNPMLNAIVTLDVDEARSGAREADEERGRGEERPLLGLPLTVKDAIDVRGLPTTAGLRRRRDTRATADSALVARLRRAGGVVMGKTNLPPYAADWQTDNRLFGRTNNPWSLDRTPGGSTGGGAAAIAAGLSPLEFGSDIGGSIRLPAAFCGIYGHRPSETALPRSGHFPGSPLPNPAAVLQVLGPLARDAGDLALAVDITAGPEVGEDVAWSLTLPPSRHERLADFRVAVLPWTDWLPVSGSVGAALEALPPLLRGLGAAVEWTQPEGFDDLRANHRLYESLLATIFSFNAGRTKEARDADARALLGSGDDFEVARGLGLTADADQFLAWHRQREEVRASFRDFFRRWDVLLAPITLTPALSHDDRPESERAVDVDGRTVPYRWQSIYPGLATLPGQPATTFPAGRTGSQLPVGLQAIGPYLEDLTAIRFAQLLADEIGGYDAPPGFR